MIESGPVCDRGTERSRDRNILKRINKKRGGAKRENYKDETSGAVDCIYEKNERGGEKKMFKKRKGKAKRESGCKVGNGENQREKERKSLQCVR